MMNKRLQVSGESPLMAASKFFTIATIHSVFNVKLYITEEEGKSPNFPLIQVKAP